MADAMSEVGALLADSKDAPRAEDDGLGEDSLEEAGASALMDALDSKDKAGVVSALRQLLELLDSPGAAEASAADRVEE